MSPQLREMMTDLRKNPPPKTVLRDDINALKLPSAGGPNTPAGKAVSSRNSLRHGLTARTAVIRCEDQAEFDALLESLTADRRPEGELELQLTGEIAASMWRLARARYHEAGILERAVGIYDNRAAHQLQLVTRYVTTIERQLNRVIVRLEAIQAQRRKSAPQISQPTTQNAQLVMAAGSSRPQFVSQTAQNTDNSQLTTHNSQPPEGVSCEVPSFEISEPSCNSGPLFQSLGVKNQEVHPGTRGQRGTR